MTVSEDPWWPEGTDDPAFQTQRQAYGIITGGDYVRGSTVVTLQQTALRYPTTFEGFDEATNKAFLTCRWYGHSTVSQEYPDGTIHATPIGVAEIGWGWPTTVKEEWYEVALVRSGFGYPATVNDGQVVFKAGRPDFSTPETPAVISPNLGYAWSTAIQRIVNNTQITGCVSITPASHVQYLAAVWMPVSGGRSWVVYLDVDGSLKFQWSLDGTADGWATPAVLATHAELAALPKTAGDLVCFGIRFTKDDAAPYVVSITSADEGVNWTEGTRVTVGGAPIADTFNASTSRLSIGARSDGIGNTDWEGNIAWVEFRDLSMPQASQVQWRFDAVDYPGTGTTWTDPRGRAWNIATDTAMSEIIPSTINVPPPVVYDKPLQQGQYYYYSLFFRTTRLDWIIGMTGQVLIPRNYNHDEHLWNTIPPFYQYTDSNIREGSGPLRKMFTIFGSELDLTREFVEQWQETYHIDKAPMALLKGVGANFGVPYNAGIGDVRYRGMLAALPLCLQQRGTVPALKHVVEAGTKWKCDITIGNNIMLLPDDSDFWTGTGSWGYLATATDVLEPDLNTTTAALSYGTGLTGATMGRGTMHVVSSKAAEATNLAITCGNGPHYIIDSQGLWQQQPAVIPMYAGIPVEPGSSYGFNVQVAQETPAAAVTGYLFWYGAGGTAESYLSKVASINPVAASGSGWHEIIVQGTAPTGAVYMTPVIYFTGRPTGGGTTSKWIDISAASCYVLDRAGKAVAVAPPDSYMTVGDAGELLGSDDAAIPFKGYILGTPPTAGPQAGQQMLPPT